VGVSPMLCSGASAVAVTPRTRRRDASTYHGAQVRADDLFTRDAGHSFGAFSTAGVHVIPEPHGAKVDGRLVQ
jgi:hypothetical protein